MLAMLSELILGFFGMFISENSEQLKLFSEQKDKGYEWHYTGVQEPPKNTKYISIPIPSILLEDKDKEYIMFQLKKGE